MSPSAEVDGAIDLFDLHCRWPLRYPFLLQSLVNGPDSGRDLLFGFPGPAIEGEAFFPRLAAAFSEQRIDRAGDEGLPFLGGWFLVLGYEAARFVEPSLRLPHSPFRWPVALAVRCPAVLVHDRATRRTRLYAESDSEQLDTLRDDLLQALRERANGAPDEALFVAEPAQEDPPQRYTQAVTRVLEYLEAGDVFQVNLSRGWRSRIGGGDYRGLYRRLRKTNPAPFAGLALWKDSALLSSSPERLISARDGRVQTRPIAGTRPRSANAEEDHRLRERLIGSLKERAEHIMLIDLERNDLGRVCVPGSVEVSELMAIESYAHVHHIVSNVRGRLRPGFTPVDALRAVFPGGTITGCPKVRAMQVIAELEGVGRGPYTGAMGYLSRCGRMDTNILIRSAICEDGWVSLRAGGGIVADSDPEAELAETRAKARGLLLALGLA